MNAKLRARHVPITACLVFACTFALYVLTLAPTLSWRNGGGDGGDLVTAAATLSVPHPSGYPTYMLLAQAFLRLPFGDEAYRLNLMSAFFASASLALLYVLLTRAASGSTPFGALGATALLACAPLFWSLATIAEVYALHVFFVVLTASLLLRWLQFPSRSSAVVLGLVIGLALGNHLTFLLLIPAVLAVFIWAQQNAHRMRSLLGDAQHTPVRT
ncbi:MAG: DUF2723 domain-containing protein, partial [Chloroflexi bacterium]|nr:DUF2723 domain-containing protein [Chloroflexota bacterium]